MDSVLERQSMVVDTWMRRCHMQRKGDVLPVSLVTNPIVLDVIGECFVLELQRGR